MVKHIFSLDIVVTELNLSNCRHLLASTLDVIPICFPFIKYVFACGVFCVAFVWCCVLYVACTAELARKRTFQVIRAIRVNSANRLN